MSRTRLCGFAAALVLLPAALTFAHQRGNRPLSDADVAVIARLVMLEDRRELDEAAITQALRADHPEVRRRAAMAIGRIAKPEGGPWLTNARTDADAAVVAAVAFATGQLKDPANIPWLEQVISAPSTSPDVAREAARSLGRHTLPEARAALTRYLLRALRHAGRDAGDRRSPARRRPVLDARRSGADSAVDEGVTRTAMASGVGVIPGAQPRRCA